MTVRVRFAPSPTGYLHIGGARTALFNWMFAKKMNGKFILRIEDTDQKRYVEGAVQVIMDGLRWLGIEWDEGPDIGGPYGPYIQTERTELYQKWADWLVEEGHAYRCYCTSDELEAMRKKQIEEKRALGYDRRCRNLSLEEKNSKEAEKTPYVIRFKMPLDGTTVVKDIIRGDIPYENIQIGDAILLKSDGYPTYHLANVIDDHFMEISHIMRADEWINTAPLHIHLYDAFGWQLPIYAHLPLVMNPSGKGKLSKRSQGFDDSGVQVLVRVEEFKDAGLLPEAVVNFLANVGWSFGEDREIFTMQEAIPRIELGDINPAPSQLPYTKLDWLNSKYIQEMDDRDLLNAVRPFLSEKNQLIDEQTLLILIPSLKIRLKHLNEINEMLLFMNESGYQPNVEKIAHKKITRPLEALSRVLEMLSQSSNFDLASLSAIFTQVGEEVVENGKPGPFLGMMRYVITGQDVSPPVYESTLALGRETALDRIQKCIELLKQK